MLRPFLTAVLFLQSALPMAAQIGFSNLSATVHPGNTLRHQFSFTTSSPARVYVRYGYAQGQDSLWLHTPVQGPGTQHQVSAIGFIPQTSYFWQATAFDSLGYEHGPIQQLSTGTIPVALPLIDTIANPGLLDQGYILVGSDPGIPPRQIQLIDRQGRTVWYEQLPGTTGESLCQAYHFDPATHRLLLIDCDSIHERDLDGASPLSIVPDLAATGRPDAVMHDEVRLGASGYEVLLAIPHPILRGSQPNDTDLVIADALAHIDANGALQLLADYRQAESPQDAALPGGHWVPRFGADACEWKAVRTFEKDYDLNWILPSGSHHQVQKFQVPGQVAWTCGPGGNITILPTDTFWTPAGLRSDGTFSYFTYDHGRSGTENRVLFWYIDWSYLVPEMFSQWGFQVPPAYATPVGGHVERLPNGHVLASSGPGGGIWELDEAGGLRWFAGSDLGLDRAFWVPSLYAPVPLSHALDTALCATDSLVPLLASPAGGVWSGPHVAGGYFGAAAALAGSFDLLYRYGPDSLWVRVTVDGSSNCGVGFVESKHVALDMEVFPQPFGEVVNLRYTMPRAGDLLWTVYALDGRTLDQGQVSNKPAGCHLVQIGTRKWPDSGPLFLHVWSNNGLSAGKWILHE